METTALATARAVQSGETSARAVCEATIARIEERDSTLNAVVVRDFERARAAADQVDARIAAGERLALAGVAMTVKESFDVAGLPTTWGFEEHREYRPAEDALAVRKLTAAGAVIVGKTNVPPALADLQSTNPVYGRTNNPFDRSRVSGGSSGGSAVALASGMVPLELGSDIGGSIRVPAHFNGVWGHKPTFGALPRDGHHFPRTDGHPGPLSVIGPLARDPADLAAALDLLADPSLPKAQDRPVDRLRVLVLTSHPVAPVHPGIAEAVAHLGEALARAGAQVEWNHPLLPDQSKQFADYMRLLSVTLARGAPSEDGISASLPDWFGMLDEQARTSRGWSRLFTEVDAVIAPVLGVPAFPHSDVALRQRTLPIDGSDTMFGLQFGWPGLATYPNRPATAFPIGLVDGLPVGAQVIADLHRDHDAIAIAARAHTLIGAPAPQPFQGA